MGDLNENLKREQDLRRRWAGIERKRDRNVAEIREGISEVNDSLKRLRKLREDLRDDERDAKADQIADRIEAQEDVKDDLLAALDDAKEKDREAEKILDDHRDRVRDLRRKREARRKSREAKGDLSAHFSIDEFNCREGGPVPSYMRPHLVDLCDRVLEKMRDRFGPARVTSGHRWSWYDAKIGGVGGYHVYEKYQRMPAADLIFERGTPAEWAAYARSLGVGGVGQYNGSGFVHVDTGPRRDWWG